MKKILLYATLGIFLLTPFSTGAATPATILSDIVNIQSVPASDRGFIGNILAVIFQPTGVIKTLFLSPFQNIENYTFDNTLVRWSKPDSTTEGTFKAGTIRDNGTRIGIGTSPHSSARVQVNGTSLFSGAITANAGIGADTNLSLAANSSIILATNGSARMRILPNGNVGIGTLSPTEKLDINGKIRMRGGTEITDTPDTLATKQYVDDRIQGKNKFDEYKETSVNIGEDFYGNLIKDSAKKVDSCDKDIVSEYVCPTDVKKSCWDIVEKIYACPENSDYYCYRESDYFIRPVICNISYYLVRTDKDTDGIKKSNNGDITITSRDYGGISEKCRVNINIPSISGSPSCLETYTSYLGSQGNDAECKYMVEQALVTGAICKNFKSIHSAKWFLSGDTGKVDIEYFGF